MVTLRGSFDVTTESESPFHNQDGVAISRAIVRKTFSGAASGTSEAQMIATRTPDPGSASYIAMEVFTGTMDGKQGSFVMQHNGFMTDGEPRLSVVIVPGSGTGDLAGISGTLEIDNVDGAHSYTFEYEIA